MLMIDVGFFVLVVWPATCPIFISIPHIILFLLLHTINMCVQASFSYLHGIRHTTYDMLHKWKLCISENAIRVIRSKNMTMMAAMIDVFRVSSCAVLARWLSPWTRSGHWALNWNLERWMDELNSLTWVLCCDVLRPRATVHNPQACILEGQYTAT